MKSMKNLVLSGICLGMTAAVAAPAFAAEDDGFSSMEKFQDTMDEMLSEGKTVLVSTYAELNKKPTVTDTGYNYEVTNGALAVPIEIDQATFEDLKDGGSVTMPDGKVVEYDGLTQYEADPVHWDDSMGINGVYADEDRYYLTQMEYILTEAVYSGPIYFSSDCTFTGYSGAEFDGDTFLMTPNTRMDQTMQGVMPLQDGSNDLVLIGSFDTDGLGLITSYQEETKYGQAVNYNEDPATSGSGSADGLLDQFLRNEIPAADPETGDTFTFSELTSGNWMVTPTEGDRLDLDNDGENEMIITMDYGGMYLDAADGQVTVLARGTGMADVLSYGYYDGAVWICHSDTHHAGRNWYHFDRYQGAGNVVDSFDLNADYWEAPDPNRYDENSDFTFRGQPISMEEFESMLHDIFANTPSAWYD